MYFVLYIADVVWCLNAARGYTATADLYYVDVLPYNMPKTVLSLTTI
jgi:hypothetical protein